MSGRIESKGQLRHLDCSMFEGNPVSIEENAEGPFMRSLVCPVGELAEIGKLRWNNRRAIWCPVRRNPSKVSGI